MTLEQSWSQSQSPENFWCGNFFIGFLIELGHSESFGKSFFFPDFSDFRFPDCPDPENIPDFGIWRQTGPNELSE